MPSSRKKPFASATYQGANWTLGTKVMAMVIFSGRGFLTARRTAPKTTRKIKTHKKILFTFSTSLYTKYILCVHAHGKRLAEETEESTGANHSMRARAR